MTHHLLAYSEPKKEFNEITQKEKKMFLSMDLIERMIRVEQRVSAHFHKLIPYNKTEYYKSLTEKERKTFENYLKNKKMKSFLKVSVFFILAVLFLLQGIKLTGSVIQESSSFSLVDMGIFFLVAISLLALTALLLSNARRREKLNDHVAVLEKVMYSVG